MVTGNNRLKSLLRLKMVPGVGSKRFCSLIAHFPDLEDIFCSTEGELKSIPGIDSKTARSILRSEPDKELDYQLKLIDKFAVKVIAYGDDDYPLFLMQIYNPPAMLFVRGDPAILNQKSISIVGSRSSTNYGHKMTQKLVEQLVKEGFVIVSGMARGIDSAAHASALKSGGVTVAVLGSGVDIVYPPENRKLMDEIISNGAVASEYFMSEEPVPGYFPERNRIISGLSYGVIVVEAPERSGALITANLALEQGKEVFAVPGNALSRNTRGTNNLIKQGAKLVLDVEDVLSEFQSILSSGSERGVRQEEKRVDVRLEPNETRVFGMLSSEPIHVDTLAEQCDMSSAEMLVVLFNLEMKDLVSQLPGKQFVKNY